MTIDPCKDEALLSALMDNELSAGHAAAVRRHMETCLACRQRFDALQQTEAMIQGMAPLTPSADFEQTFWRKVADLEERGQSRSRHRFLSLLSGWRPVLATVLAAGLAAVIVIYTGQDIKPTPEEVFMAQNMELLQNYDVIDHLDILEQWDAIETMEESS